MKKAPPPPHIPELRPDHEIEDNPTMHPDHELRGRRKQAKLGPGHRGSRLARAFITGTLISGVLWIILSFVGIEIAIILPVLATIWVGSISLFYGVHR